MTDNRSYTVELSGGLGNQMFQYALGRSLSLRHGANLLLDTRLVDADPQRSFALSQFHIVGEAANLPPLRKRGRWEARARRLLGRLPIYGAQRERAFPFNPRVLELRPPVRLVGYWQTERYFADVEPILRGDFQLAIPLAASTGKLAELIGERNAVSVHVRRGDYVTNPVANAYHGTCSPEWYAKAKLALEERVTRPAYVLFSDDPDWVRKNLPEFGDALFVDPEADRSDAEDQYLMSLCRHHIIANSSFSWWGAWLNARADKVVIAPKVWFLHKGSDTRDLIPGGWTKL